MAIIEITDFSARELDAYARLTEAQLRNRLEPELGLFIAESPKVISSALDAGCVPVSILTERRNIDGQARGIIARCGDIPVYTADRELLSKLTGYTLTRGVLCAMRRPKLPSVEAVCENARRIAVLENIADVVNIGALFRSAAALGMDAVLISAECCDPLCRRAVRVSMGAVFMIPWTRLPAENPLTAIKNAGFKTVAMALRSDALSVDDTTLTAEKKLAVILGSEGYGLLPETIENSDYKAIIPMQRGIDSLNVAAAGAIAFRQLVKQS